MSESHPKYWQIKATVLEFQMKQQELEIILQKRNKLMQEAGLDLNKNYALDDATETINERSESDGGRTNTN